MHLPLVCSDIMYHVCVCVCVCIPFQNEKGCIGRICQLPKTHQHKGVCSIMVPDEHGARVRLMLLQLYYKDVEQGI